MLIFTIPGLPLTLHAPLSHISLTLVFQDVWLCDFNNRDTQNTGNRFRKIMSNTADTQKYFENMSAAYASMCSTYANLLTPDINNIPTNGIWDRIEQPMIERTSDFDPPKGKIDLVS